MEDIIKTILDVVRAQHTATEGTDAKPFDMDDIVDMALGVMGRPDEPEDVASMTDSIQGMVESLAPDLFPPKSFEQMDDDERTASVTSMLENRLKNGFTGQRPASAAAPAAPAAPAPQPVSPSVPRQDSTSASQSDPQPASQSDVQSDPQPVSQAAFQEDYSSSYSPDGDEPGDTSNHFDPKETAELNELIYKNLMEMMGAQPPKVEYPFDRSMIRYGKEKSVTEQLMEEEAEKKRQSGQNGPARMTAADLAQSRIEQDEPSTFSAWDLAQNAVGRDEEAHRKEPYKPKPEEKPKTKSASQLAAEAIARAQEEDKMKLEVEKQAEALMAEAAKRGQDPMKFALHQQEILRYMEKNSDELVSFEDYEDLSPEEKLELERQIYIEKQISEGVDPDKVDTEVPKEYIPAGLKGQEPNAQDASADSQPPVLTEEMLRMLSQQVISENSDMILAENADEDMEGLSNTIFENLKQMMSGSGQPVPQEDVGDLIEQVITANRENQMPEKDKKPESGKESGAEEKPESGKKSGAEEKPESGKESGAEEKPESGKESGAEEIRHMSAVEMARAAQKAARVEPAEERKTKSAADLAREAQEKARAAKQNQGLPQDDPLTGSQEESEDSLEAVLDSLESDFSDETFSVSENDVNDSAEDSKSEPDPTDEIEEFESDETEPDPDELVLGEHTQAEVDEALENLATLGLEGDVYERARRMLLLELAGSEAELDAWLKQEETRKKKKVSSLLSEETVSDISELDEEELERELELAFDEDFTEEDFEDSEAAAEEEDQEAVAEEEDQEAVAEEEDQEAVAEEEDQEAVAVEENQDAVTEVEIQEAAAEIEDREASGIIDVDPGDTESEFIGVIEPEESEQKDDVPSGEAAEAGPARKGKAGHRRKVFRKREKPASKESDSRFTDEKELNDAHEKGYQISTRKPFILKNSASFMDQFEDFIADTQENRRLSTGFRRLDAMLRYGLHKGSYFIDAQPQYLKNGFMQQLADRIAESGIDVLYISTELSRYDLMVETIARLSYEIHQGDPERAVSAMAIMTGEDGAQLSALKDELNWYRGRISEHLFILDQEAVSEYSASSDDASAGDILTELISSIVREGAHKPAVFIDNIESILSTEDSEDMKPFMEGMRKLARELGIPILMSYGYAQAESEEDLYPEEREYHESLGNMCDVYIELQYADMISEDLVPLTQEDIRDMVEEGESLLINVFIHKNRRPMKASMQIQGTPKYNHFEE